MTVHRAILTNADYLQEGEDGQWFASLDGERWLPVDREPKASDEEDVAALFGSHESDDGRAMRYLTFATRYLHHMGACILETV